MMKTKTKVEEQEKEEKAEQERVLKLLEQDQVNLRETGYFRQQFLANLERSVQAKEKNTEAIEKLVKLVESSDESVGKTEEP